LSKLKIDITVNGRSKKKSKRSGSRGRKRKKKNFNDYETLFWIFIIFTTVQTGALTDAFYIAIAIGVGLASIYGLFKYWKYRRLKRSNIDQIDKMDGIKFEKYLKVLFKSMGYSVKLTSASGDYGADLILKDSGKIIVIQAKRYSKNVGIDAVQQVAASIPHYSAEEAWVVTNQDYTKAAYNLANSNGVRLINREELIKLILSVEKDQKSMNKVRKDNKVKEGNNIDRVVDDKVPCDKCGGDMVLKNGKHGYFLGCSSFPKCRFTKTI
jgi:restriction system protein